jgi:hypothetical protein
MLQDGVLVAHNAPFDVAFLAAEYKRAGLAMPEVPAICTLRLARRLGLEVASFSLADCCAHFGIPHQRRHRADEDVEATVQLLQQLLPLASARGWDSVDALADALAPAGDELVYNLSHVQLKLAGPSCSAVIDGTSGTASDGIVTFTYATSTATLTVLPNGGNLHFYHLNGCAGLLTAGDPATISGKLSVRPKQTITSP